MREHMGDKVADDFSRWFEENVQHPDGGQDHDQYHEVLSRLDVLEERFDHVDEQFDHMGKRLDQMEERFEGRCQPAL